MEEVNRIKQIREYFNLTVEDLSKTLSVPKRTIGSYERGEAPPNEKFILALIEKLNINANWFLTGFGDMIIPPNGKGSINQIYNKLTNEQLELITEIIQTETGYKLLVELLNLKKMKKEGINKIISTLQGINSYL